MKLILGNDNIINMIINKWNESNEEIGNNNNEIMILMIL